MKKITRRQQTGAALLIYLLIMSVFVGLLMLVTYSRLLLALKRNQSTTDSLVLNYAAESEINDVIARLTGRYLSTPLNISIPKTIGGDTFTIVGTQNGDTQTISVTGNSSFASTKLVAERTLQTLRNIQSVDIILSLDCTESMDAGASCTNCFSKPTRFNAQEDAAVEFVTKLSSLPDRDKFRLGVSVFGIDAKWLSYGGRDVKPDSGMTLDDVKAAIQNGFGDTRAESPACNRVMDATSIGSAFAFSHDYFAQPHAPNVKQIEVVVTDGIPNSRIPYGACAPSVFCPAFPVSDDGSTNHCENNAYGWTCHQYSSYKDGPYVGSDYFNSKAYNTCAPLGFDFLQCTIADKDTTVPSVGKGARDPSVDAYAVTILSSPPSNVVSAFSQYLGVNNYFNASRASQLKNLLNTILNEIIADHETIILKKDIPGS